jgi:hypothetical protein
MSVVPALRGEEEAAAARGFGYGGRGTRLATEQERPGDEAEAAVGAGAFEWTGSCVELPASDGGRAGTGGVLALRYDGDAAMAPGTGGPLHAVQCVRHEVPKWPPGARVPATQQPHLLPGGALQHTPLRRRDALCWGSSSAAPPLTPAQE